MKRSENLLTIKEAADLAGVTTTTIYKHLKRGSIEFQTSSCGLKQVKKVREADIIEFFERGLKRIEPISKGFETVCNHFETGLKQIENRLQQIETKHETALVPVKENTNQIMQFFIEENQTLKNKTNELQKKIEAQEQEEKDLLATIKELKRQLEEEKNRPWYKRII